MTFAIFINLACRAASIKASSGAPQKSQKSHRAIGQRGRLKDMAVQYLGIEQWHYNETTSHQHRDFDVCFGVEIVEVNSHQRVTYDEFKLKVGGRYQFTIILLLVECCMLLVYPTESNRSCRWFAMLKIVNAMDHSQRAARAWVDSHEIGWNSNAIPQNWKLLPCCVVDNDVWLGTKDKFQRPAPSRNWPVFCTKQCIWIVFHSRTPKSRSFWPSPFTTSCSAQSSCVPNVQAVLNIGLLRKLRLSTLFCNTCL